jgi:DNA-binding NarL/FixJ family response regulator
MWSTMPFFCPGKRKQLFWQEKATLSAVRVLNIYQSEEQLVKDILKLHQHAHHDGHPAEAIPPMPVIEHELSAREIEVLVLITKGFINKEIADKLNISLTTVITHRKNITEKLGIKSVSGLTIYAVMNGYVEADRI